MAKNDSTPIRERVVFYSGCDAVVGEIFIPRGLAEGERRAAVVLAPGYVATKEMPYGQAEDLTLEGYVALAFDYRGSPGASKLWGADNPPGVIRIYPEECVRDIRAAVTYLSTRKEVIPDRIGLIGGSAGGSYVVPAAAAEPRVKCVISEGGIGDGYRWARLARGSWQFREYIRKIEDDKVKKVLTGVSEVIPTTEFMQFNPSEIDSWVTFSKFFPKMAQLELMVPLEACEAWLEFKPELVVDKISPRAILFICQEVSDIVPPEEVPLFYEKAKEPKKLVVVPASIVPTRYAKFRLDQGARYIPWIWNHMMEWFREYLPARTT